MRKHNIPEHQNKPTKQGRVEWGKVLAFKAPLWSADRARGPGIAKQLKWLKNDFPGPKGKWLKNATQILTISQRPVIFRVIFESLSLGPDKSFLSHRKCHLWIRDLPNGVSQPEIVPRRGVCGMWNLESFRFACRSLADRISWDSHRNCSYLAT